MAALASFIRNRRRPGGKAWRVTRYLFRLKPISDVFLLFCVCVCVCAESYLLYITIFNHLDVQGNENLWARLICLGALLLLQFYITRVEPVSYLLLRGHNAHTHLLSLKIQNSWFDNLINLIGRPFDKLWTTEIVRVLVNWPCLNTPARHASERSARWLYKNKQVLHFDYLVLNSLLYG